MPFADGEQFQAERACVRCRLVTSGNHRPKIASWPLEQLGLGTGTVREFSEPRRRCSRRDRPLAVLPCCSAMKVFVGERCSGWLSRNSGRCRSTATLLCRSTADGYPISCLWVVHRKRRRRRRKHAGADAALPPSQTRTVNTGRYCRTGPPSRVANGGRCRSSCRRLSCRG